MSQEVKHISRFELLMDAGFGAQKAGDILIKAFAKTGHYVYIEPMFPSEISPPPRSRPAMSGVIVRIADENLTNIGNSTDLMIAQHEIVLDRRLDDQETNSTARVLLDMGDRKANEESYEKVCKRLTKLGLDVFPFELDDKALQVIRELGGKGRNMYYIGILAEVYNLPPETVVQEIRQTFGKKLKEDILERNIKLFELGYLFAKEKLFFTLKIDGHATTDNKILIDGNSAMSLGIIDAGIKLVSGYPITPASSIIHTLAQMLPSYGGMVHQAEDEIAAIGTAVGSYFGGVPAVTCTSGPGLSLKQEFIGFATAAEIPLIVIDAQRSGPSTGMPTRTEQSDLLAALFGSHGDNAKVILSVSNVLDCFYAPQMARYLAEKLHLPVFILTDFQTANCYKVIEKPEVSCIDDIEQIPDHVFERFHIRRLPFNIEMVRDRQSVPGTPGEMRRVTGLNTDRHGSVSYFAGTNQRAHMVRNQKIHHVKRAMTFPEMFGDESGDVLVIGWGSTRGAIEEAVNNCRKKGIRAAGIHLRIVYPLPPMLRTIFSRFKKVFTVELAYGDALKPPPLMTLLRAETLVNVNSVICRATGRPIRPQTIFDKILDVLMSYNI